MITLRMSGIRKVLDGVTTTEEILRVTMADRTERRHENARTGERAGRLRAEHLHQLLKRMVEKGASDMHITTGRPPLLRIDGNVVPLELPPLTPVDTKQLCYSVLTEEQKIAFEKDNELDSRSA